MTYIAWGLVLVVVAFNVVLPIYDLFTGRPSRYHKQGGDW